MEHALALALHDLPDDELLRRLGDLVVKSRRLEADLVAHIGEVDERRLYARFGFPSMFAYCTQHLHLSEAEAYRRITVARAARRHASLLERLRDGRLNLSGAATLVPLLTEDNAELLVERATHLTKRQIEELVAELSPRPHVPASVRKLPELPLRPAPSPRPEPANSSTRPAGHDRASRLVPGRVVTEEAPTPPTTALARSSDPSSKSVVEPLCPGRYKVQFTASGELRDKLERLTALMRSEVPDGDLAAIIERAVTEKLARLEARRFAATTAPRQALTTTDTKPTTRHVPAAIRRAVRERDGDRCRFVDEQGRRCSERHRLEYHHRHPFGMGGDHSPDNISLLCPAHNRRLAEHDYGRARIGRRASETPQCIEARANS